MRNEPALEQLAEACLTHLIANPEALGAFMVRTGYDGAGLKAALGTDTLQRGLIDYVAGDEALLLAVCANAGLHPEQFMAAWQRQNRVA